MAHELEQALIGWSAAAPPSHILEGLDAELAARKIAGAPRTIYEEVWHLAFWQQVSIDWFNEVVTPCPDHDYQGFPTEADTSRESWEELRKRFLAGAEEAAAIARDEALLKKTVRCPSPKDPARTMTVEDQMISLAAHNHYHLGRVVLLRQIEGAWPPASGGFTW